MSNKNSDAWLVDKNTQQRYNLWEKMSIPQPIKCPGTVMWLSLPHPNTAIFLLSVCLQSFFSFLLSVRWWNKALSTLDPKWVPWTWKMFSWNFFYFFFYYLKVEEVQPYLYKLEKTCLIHLLNPITDSHTHKTDKLVPKRTDKNTSHFVNEC